MSNNTRKQIVLSVKDKNLVAAQNTRFSTASFDVTSLQSVLTSNNYSSIAWRDRRRVENFSFATAAPLDFDAGLTIQNAEATLGKHNLNYALITSKSHTPAAHRFRVIIPFQRKILSAKDYKRVIRELRDSLFPSMDPNAMDAARFFYYSPAGSHYSSRWNGVDYDPDVNLGSQIKDAWDDSLLVTTGHDEETSAVLLQQKTPIYCPFHDDASPSAFVDRKKGTGEPFIHCSACGKTYWMLERPLVERCKNYWSYQSEVYEFGIKGGRFFMSKIGLKKFFGFVNAVGSKQEKEAFRYLLSSKHISTVNLVKHVVDPSPEATTYSVDNDAGDVIVNYAPIPERTQDNQFIEDYLTNTFGQYKQFIKEYLATYCYSDFRDLPTLVLKGARCSGKNTFAEMVYSIFPAISQMWEAKRSAFTQEAEKKLLVADETVSESEEVYRLIKQYSGSKHATVNKKYVIPYEVENNMNIIILSNSAMPIYVASYEAPTSPETNQFFVYDFKPIAGPIDARLGEKLEERIGHYVRTTLKDVFDKLDFSGNRYSIKVPITPEEAGLFDSNVTEEEMAAEKMIDRVLEKSQESGFEYADHLKDGFLPTAMLEDSLMITKLGVHKVVKALRERGYLEQNKAAKVERNNKRRGCYTMTDKLKKLLGIIPVTAPSEPMPPVTQEAQERIEI